MRRAKIMCTLGPATSSEEAIEALILAGMDVARINFSHGNYEIHRTTVNRVRSISTRLGKTVGILQDLQGPKIRTRQMKDGAIVLETGKRTVITTQDIEGTAERFATQYELLPKDVKSGDLILLDDGKLSLWVVSVADDQEITCEILHGGVLKSNKGINVPSGGMSVQSLTEKDRQDVHFGAQVGVDAVALSFVRSAADVRMLRKELAMAKSRPLVIAKLEKQQAIEQLEEILEESDGVMVARGDLGVEMPLEQVPIVQKRIVDEAVRRGKAVIVATQMLESMITEPRPTRAEASDVANAVLDGTDMLMLSAETASGKYPVEAVQMMDRIIRHAENSALARYWRTDFGLETKTGQFFQNAVSLAAVRACEELKAAAIAIYTTSGATAHLVSDYRPRVPVIAFVPEIKDQRRLCFAWGVETEILALPANTETLQRKINERLQKRGYVKPGETIVLLTKIPLAPSQRTNTVHVHTITPILPS